MKNDYKVYGDVTVIYVSCKSVQYECLISTSKLKKAQEFFGRWTAYVSHAGHMYVVGNFVDRETGRRKIVPIHRFITGVPNGMLVDHVNHNTLDNRDCNLNIVNKAENMQNRSGLDKNNSSGVRGVTWDKQCGKWKARVKANGEYVFSKNFSTLEEAKVAVENARIQYVEYLRRISEAEV